MRQKRKDFRLDGNDFKKMEGNLGKKNVYQLNQAPRAKNPKADTNVRRNWSPARWKKRRNCNVSGRICAGGGGGGSGGDGGGGGGANGGDGGRCGDRDVSGNGGGGGAIEKEAAKQAVASAAVLAKEAMETAET